MVFNGFNGDGGTHALILTAQDRCSYCNDPMTAMPLIVWHFHHADIWLHRRCAIELAQHLQKDAANSAQ